MVPSIRWTRAATSWGPSGADNFVDGDGGEAQREVGEDEGAVVALLKKTSAWMPRTLRGLVLISMLLLELEKGLKDDVVKDRCRSGVCVVGICHAL